MQEIIPALDGTLDYIGVTKLRAMNIQAFRELRRPLAIITTEQEINQPLAVVISYRTYVHLLKMALRVAYGPETGAGPEG